jgi:hypothetical protein
VPAIDRLRTWVSQDIPVEEGLARLRDERHIYPEANAQLAAIRYYLRATISGLETRWHSGLNHVTNYVTLIDRLCRYHHERGRTDPVCVVTFNYDTLIERAMKDVMGANLISVEDYSSRPDVQLFKPHGSANWLRQAVVSIDDWRRLRSYGSPQDAENDVIELSQRASVQPVRNNYVIRESASPIDPTGSALGDGLTQAGIWIPALAIPTVSKQYYEAPESHIDNLTARVAEATEVLVIGWRGAERHFLRLLHENLPHSTPVTVVAERESAAMFTVSQLWPTSKFDRYRLIADGFSEMLAVPNGQHESTLDRILASELDWIDRDPEVGDFSDDPVEDVDDLWLR